MNVGGSWGTRGLRLTTNCVLKSRELNLHVLYVYYYIIWFIKCYERIPILYFVLRTL